MAITLVFSLFSFLIFLKGNLTFGIILLDEINDSMLFLFHSTFGQQILFFLEEGVVHKQAPLSKHQRCIWCGLSSAWSIVIMTQGRSMVLRTNKTLSFGWG